MCFIFHLHHQKLCNRIYAVICMERNILDICIYGWHGVHYKFCSHCLLSVLIILHYIVCQFPFCIVFHILFLQFLLQCSCIKMMKRNRIENIDKFSAFIMYAFKSKRVFVNAKKPAQWLTIEIIIWRLEITVLTIVLIPLPFVRILRSHHSVSLIQFRFPGNFQQLYGNCGFSTKLKCFY